MPSLQSILSIAIPCITFFLMLIVGMDLTENDFRKVARSPRSFIIGTLLQYLLPVVAICTFKIIRAAPEITAGMILLASAPGGGISNFYTYLARANVALSVVLTAFSCVAAVVTMPFLLQLFQAVLADSTEFQFPVRVLFGQLTFLLVVPILTGVFLRHRFSSFTTRYESLCRKIGIFALAALIAFVLFQTSELFFLQWRQITIAAALFIILSMGVGFVSGIILRAPRTDSVTIGIELGVRNVAIATTTAVVFLNKTEFATFAAIYFLVEAILILAAVAILKKFLSKAQRRGVI